MQAEIIAVGSELLTPDRIDTNSLFLTQRLNHLGIAVARKTVVGDQHEHVRDAFRCALDRCDLVVSSGGLGPTLEDRKSTRLNSSHRCISYAVFCLKKKK